MKAGGVGYGIRDDVSGVAGNAACAVAKVAGHVRTPLPPERKSSRAVSRRSWHAGQLKPLPCKNLLGIAPLLQAAADVGPSAANTFRFMTADSIPFRVALMQHGVSEAAFAPLTKHGSGILCGRARVFVFVSDGSRARPGCHGHAGACPSPLITQSMSAARAFSTGVPHWASVSQAAATCWSE